MRYWKRLNSDGSTKTAGSYSSNLAVVDAIEITKDEYDAFIASLPVVEPEPPLVFEPPPGTGIPERVEYIEQYLNERQRRELL